MIPRFYRQTAPQYTSPQATMVAGNARAGIGTALQGLGSAVTQRGEQKIAREDALAVSRAWRSVEEWHDQFLRGLPERRKNLTQTSVDPVSGEMRTGYQMEQDKYGDLFKEQLDLASSRLSTRAREALQRRFDAYAPAYTDQAFTSLDHMELEDIAGEIQAMAKEDRLSEAQELLDRYGDKFSAADKEVLQSRMQAAALETRVSNAQTFLQDVAKEQGWEGASAMLDDPDWQQAFGLDIGDSAQVKNQIETFVRTGLAQAERARTQEAEQQRATLFANALKGELADPSLIDTALRSQVISPAEGKDLYKLIADGSAETNDFQALAKINTMIDGIEAGRFSTPDVLKEIDRNLTKLTPAKRDSLIERATNVFSFQNRSLSDTRRYAVSQLITVNESMLERLYSMGTSTETLKPIEDRRAFEYRLVEYVEDQLGTWIRAHPEATPDDVQVQGRRLISQVRDLDQARRQSMLDAWETVESPAATAWEGPNEGVVPMGSPAGLESVWGSLSDEEKRSASAFLAAGGTVDQVLEALR